MEKFNLIGRVNKFKNHEDEKSFVLCKISSKQGGIVCVFKISPKQGGIVANLVVTAKEKQVTWSLLAQAGIVGGAVTIARRLYLIKMIS